MAEPGATLRSYSTRYIYVKRNRIILGNEVIPAR
jgi:hypothetical protein